MELGVSGTLIRNIALAAFATVLAGCTSDMGKSLSLGLDTKKDADKPVDQTVVVQGACPQVVLREGTAFYTVYAKGAKKTPDGQADPEKLSFQATLSDTTRQCKTQGQSLIITVVAYGRLVSGPAGAPKTVQMPIRVAATDGDQTVYSELVQYPVTLDDTTGSTQFIFNKADVVLPNGVGPLTKVFVGFDEGPYNTE